jgi:hypothetical protein
LDFVPPSSVAELLAYQLRFGQLPCGAATPVCAPSRRAVDHFFYTAHAHAAAPLRIGAPAVTRARMLLALAAWLEVMG